MPAVTVLHASAVARQDLNGILAEYLALEHLRVFRRLLVMRFGGAIGVVALAGAGLGRLSTSTWIGSIGMFSIVLVWVWLAERRCERRLRRRLNGVPGVSFEPLPSTAVGPCNRKEALSRG